MRFEGIIIGFSSFALIGLLHPIVIKAEFYIGTKIWPAFLFAGLISIAMSLLLQNSILSAVFSILGFSLLWSIHELFQQKKRVEKGWFPDNPNKKRG
jgi:hypothetical protein